MEELVAPDPAFWAGKSVLVTGHTGFKGVWLCHWLHQMGARVWGFALAPEASPNIFDQSGLIGKVDHVIGDIRDADAVQHRVHAVSPDIVFHLAAQPLVRLSYAQPIETFATNVMGTAHVLQAIRSTPAVRCTVVVTTDKCYENQNRGRAFVESDALGGYDPYSASKAAAELVAGAFRSSFMRQAGQAVATARAGNVIGGGDWAVDRLVPDCARAFLSGDVVRVRNPNATRPWQHVLEPLAGYLILAEQLYRAVPQTDGAFNFGPSTETIATVSDVVALMSTRWGANAAWAQDLTATVHEAALLAVDSTKAHTVLGWRPRLTLNDAIALTVDWYKAVMGGASAEAMTVKQILAYSTAEPSSS